MTVRRVLSLGAVVTFLLLRSYEARCETRVIGKGGTPWSSGISLWNATIRYQNIELLNGWDPANFVNIVSGGSSQYLKAANRKYAIKYQAVTDRAVTRIGLLPCCYFPEADQPVWRVGLQADSNSKPSGQFLVSGTFGGGTIADEQWKLVDVTRTALEPGRPYWIVVQYESGPQPTGTAHWIGFYASTVRTYGPYASTEPPLASNYAGADPNVGSKGTTVKVFNGTQWIADPNERFLPTFLLEFEDGSFHGQCYRHNYVKVYGALEHGQAFTVHGCDKTVDRIAAPWSPGHSENQDIRPSGDLHFLIRENDVNGALVAQGTLLAAKDIAGGKIGFSTSHFGESARKWYEKAINPPVTLQQGKTYFLYFRSPDSTSSGYWLTDGPNSMPEPNTGDVSDSVLLHSTYGGLDAYDRHTTNSWKNTIVWKERDSSFGFHLVEVLDGSAEAIFGVAGGSGSGSWRVVSTTAVLPSSTKVKLAVASSADGQEGSYSSWQVLADPVESDRAYELPAIHQQRYVKVRLALHTSDASRSPEIVRISMTTGPANGPDDGGPGRADSGESDGRPDAGAERGDSGRDRRPADIGLDTADLDGCSCGGRQASPSALAFAVALLAAAWRQTRRRGKTG